LKRGGLAARQRDIGAAEFSLNEIRVLVGIAATIAIAGACSRSGSHDGGTHIGVGLHRGAYLVNFIDGQLTSAFPHKYSVFFLSQHNFSPLFLVIAACPQITDRMCLRLSRL